MTIGNPGEDDGAVVGSVNVGVRLHQATQD